MKSFKSYVLQLICCFIFGASYAQVEEPTEDLSSNSQFWIDYNLKKDISEKRYLTTQIAFRSISPYVYNRFVVSPTYHFRHLKPLSILKIKTPIIHSFQLGGSVFYTDFFDTPDNIELRLMQGFQIYTPEVWGIFLKNYVRLEQRLQKLFDDSRWSTSARLRYKVSTVLEWKNSGLPIIKGLYIPLNVEFFFNFNKANLNNNHIRISPGLGYKFNADWRAELSLTYQNSTNTSSRDQTTNDFVLRLRIFNTGSGGRLFRKNKKDQAVDLLDE